MTDIDIAFGWNAFQNCNAQTCRSVDVSESGIQNWSDANIVISIFFYVAVQAYINLSVLSEHLQRDAELLVNIPQLKKSFNIQFKSNNLNPINIGHIQIATPGYYKVEFSATKSNVNLQSGNFPALKTLRLGGISNKSQLTFVDTSYTSVWGRRGPSVHLWYDLQNAGDVQQFNNEVTVPKGSDVIGTYAMAIGCAQGYFGMQVNSETERRILFSIWSPQTTDDPNSISKENKVILVQKGANVVTNDFGGEGSGGQSYLVYPWVAGVAYKFRLTGQPTSDGYSVYSAYFQDPTKSSQYMLIATWKRPKTQTYLKSIYSFVENFHPEFGNVTRKVYFNNQTALNRQGKTIKIKQATFTYDGTGIKKQRIDYDGGVESKNGFFLRNCGFFNPTAQYRAVFTRP